MLLTPSVSDTEWVRTEEGFSDLSSANGKTLAECKDLCIQTTGCHAISRRASAGESSSNCWLETSTKKSSDKPGAAYRTFVKPSKSPESAAAAAAAVPAPAAAGGTLSYIKYHKHSP